MDCAKRDNRGIEGNRERFTSCFTLLVVTTSVHNKKSNITNVSIIFVII